MGCIATVPEPMLLISNRYYIRNVTLSGNHEELLSMNLTNAVALDFHWDDRKIYWSDVTASASRIMRMSDDGSNREVSTLKFHCKGKQKNWSLEFYIENWVSSILDKLHLMAPVWLFLRYGWHIYILS